MTKVTKRTGAAWTASVLLAFICGLAVYRSMGFVYAIADDVIMRDIASGAFTGTPDGHLIFVQYALGWLLSRLYLMNRTVDWYGFFMAGAMFFSLAAVLYRGLAAEKSFRWKLIYAVAALGVWTTTLLFHAAQFEWTVSAVALGAAALYLYVSAGQESRRVTEEILIWLLLVFTYGIRSDVFLMTLPGFGIAFLWKTVRRNGKKWEIKLRELILPGLVFFSIGLLILAEKTAYRGEEWKEFQRFQTARSEVYDYEGVPSYEADSEFFQNTLGISSEEVRALRHYALYLVDGLDAGMMEDLSQEASLQNGAARGLRVRLKAGIKLAVTEFLGSAYGTVSLAAAAFFSLSLILLWKKKKSLYIPVFLFLCAHGGLWLVLGYAGRLPERVAFSLHLVMLGALAGLFMAVWNRETEQKKRMQCILGFLCLIFAGAAAWQWKSSAESNREKLEVDTCYQSFKEACKSQEERLYFIETYMAEPVGGAKVTAHGNFALNRCLTLGDWYSTSPLDRERMETLGIRNVGQTLLEDPQAFLVVRDAPDPGFYASYVDWKYPEAKLVLKEIKEVEGRNFYLYQIQE